MTEAAAVAGFSAEAVLVRTAEALDATSGARGQTGRQRDDVEDRSILGRESADGGDMARTFCEGPQGSRCTR